jgi:chromosome segregation ATPase
MSEITGIIDALESRIEKLFQKIDSLENHIVALKKELNTSVSANEKQSEEVAAMKSAYESLKLANSLLGSDENKRDTKLKINSLIREIDYCIAQLAD